MDKKTAVEKLRTIALRHGADDEVLQDSLLEIANVFDPVKINFGEPVIWTDGTSGGYGLMGKDCILTIDRGFIPLYQIEIKPMKTPKENEIIFQYPSLEKWPKDASSIQAHFSDGVRNVGNICRLITRAKLSEKKNN